MLGAVDPARVQLDLQPPPSLARTPRDLLVRLIRLSNSCPPFPATVMLGLP